MADRLRFHPLVPDDLRHATAWYDEISLELGNRFRQQVNARLDDINQRPNSFVVAFDDIHFALISRFPYLVLFRETGTVVHVLGIFHTASDPDRWRQRTSNS